MIYQCQFSICQSKVWFPGFKTEKELHQHMKLHRCQWIYTDEEGKYAGSCTYIPFDDDDLERHLTGHLANDRIPSDTRKSRKVWYCPWEVCSSSSYANKGSNNRSHMVDHIKKHLARARQSYPQNRSVVGPKSLTVQSITGHDETPMSAHSSHSSTVSSYGPVSSGDVSEQFDTHDSGTLTQRRVKSQKTGLDELTKPRMGAPTNRLSAGVTYHANYLPAPNGQLAYLQQSLPALEVNSSSFSRTSKATTTTNNSTNDLAMNFMLTPSILDNASARKNPEWNFDFSVAHGDS